MPKKFLILKPEQMGLLADRTYYFIETKKGYKCKVAGENYIGYPKMLVENNRIMFKRQRDRIPK
jgi:hypothetical protein